MLHGMDNWNASKSFFNMNATQIAQTKASGHLCITHVQEVTKKLADFSLLLEQISMVLSFYSHLAFQFVLICYFFHSVAPFFADYAVREVILIFARTQ